MELWSSKSKGSRSKEPPEIPPPVLGGVRTNIRDSQYSGEALTEVIITRPFDSRLTDLFFTTCLIFFVSHVTQRKCFQFITQRSSFPSIETTLLRGLTFRRSDVHTCI